MTTFAAVDLGASSGRVITGRLKDDRLDLTEVHRFPNDPVRVAGTLRWDVRGLYREILTGLRAAGPFGSVGVDSWAVDYGLLDDAGRLLDDPFHYRDGRTDGVMDRLNGEIGADVLYAVNGLQVLPFNTIYQLAASPLPRDAATLLMIPDLIAYWLTGEIGVERTNASTTGLYDVRTGTWSSALLDRLGLPATLFPPLRSPADPSGKLLPETGLPPIPVTAVGSHDTASAVVAVPATGPSFGYVSCGTWSLAGVELPAPVLTERSRQANFTNETGVDGTIRYLRNVMGLWILQESLRAWGSPPLAPLLAAAAAEPALRSVVNPDDPAFLPPGDMPSRLMAACAGQPIPETRPQLVRCIIDSLALGHRAALREAAALSGRDLEVVHLVGGGSRNALLCQATADACGLPVVAGPAEATALGNILVQARAFGLVDDLPGIRALVARSQELRRYEPAGRESVWTEAASRVGL